MRGNGKLFSKRFLNVLFTLFTLVLLSFIVYAVFQGRKDIGKSDCKKLTFSGSYSYDGVTFYTIDENTEFGPTRESKLVVKGHFEEDIDGGKPLFMFARGLNIRMYVNDTEVPCQTQEAPDQWAYVSSVKIGKDDEVVLIAETIQQPLANVYLMQFMDGMYESTRYDIVVYMLRKDILSVMMSIVVIVLGLGMMMYRISYSRDREYDATGMLSCAMVMTAGGLSGLVDLKYVTLMIDNSFMMTHMDQVNQTLMGMSLIAYINRYLVKDTAKKINNFVVVMMTVLAMLFMVKSMIFPTLGSVDSIYIGLMAFAVVFIIYELFELFCSMKESSSKVDFAFESLLIFAISCLIEMVYFLVTGTYFVKLFEVALFLFAALHYYLLLSNNIENYQKAKKTNELEHELSQNKIKVVISQIQPHFLYNAIATIRALCLKNPEEARNGLDYFAKYLRANMDSLSEDGCIPFAKELDHTKSYLYIEKLRFGDLLEIQYDIEATDFEFPPLALQTMAENAVKHGLLAQKDGGRLKISTKETDKSYVVKVEDNGIGYDMTKPLDSGRSHVGIYNTRQRVASLCDGTLNVVSKVGAGTTVTITVPKRTEGE